VRDVVVEVVEEIGMAAVKVLLQPNVAAPTTAVTAVDVAVGLTAERAAADGPHGR